MEEIRTWRRGRRISIEAAGGLAGVGGVQWSRYDTGRRRIPAESLHAVSRVTGISPEALRPGLASLVGLAGSAA